MEARVGVVICNSNKKEYVLRCIDSLQKQTFREFKVFMVDNASEDGSAEAVEDAYGAWVEVIRLRENIGGTGGFNAGMRRAMQEDVPYLLLLDNDVVLEKGCLEELHDSMEAHPEIGVEGCKILRMDEPDLIQEFAPMLDPGHVGFILRYRGERDGLPLLTLLPCDYVPACAMMVRRSALDRVGLMPEENFIYYDDIEWCARFRRTGWQVAGNSRAKAWHKGGAALQPTTFSVYYFNRNKTRFYMGYFPEVSGIGPEETEELMRERCESILRDVFEGCFVCYARGQYNVAKTRMDAFLDGVEGRMGRAEPWKIRAYEKGSSTKLSKWLEGKRRVFLITHGDDEATARVLDNIRKAAPAGQMPEILLLETGGEPGRNEIQGIPVRRLPLAEELEQTPCLNVCPHVYRLELERLDKCYVDIWGNLIADGEDYELYLEYRRGLEFFRLCYEERLLEAMRKRMAEGFGGWSGND